MKTKSVVFALSMAFVSVAAVAADPVGPKVVIVNQKEAGIYKVIYEGGQAGRVTMKIYNSAGKVVLDESYKGMEGFMLPLNFSGMKPGEYTIEVANASGKQTKTVSYKVENKNQTIHVSKLGGESKYLLAVGNSGAEEINVRIFDGDNNLVHNENLTINGNFGQVYNLKNVTGLPSFEVTNQMGTTKVVKY